MVDPLLTCAKGPPLHVPWVNLGLAGRLGAWGSRGAGGTPPPCQPHRGGAHGGRTCSTQHSTAQRGSGGSEGAGVRVPICTGHLAKCEQTSPAQNRGMWRLVRHSKPPAARRHAASRPTTIWAAADQGTTVVACCGAEDVQVGLAQVGAGFQQL